jgi:hypothetical protein
MPCTVKKTFQSALDTNSHLLVQLEENQPGLLQKIENAVRTAAPLARHETLDQGKRMRHETRIVEVFDPAPAV